MGVLKTTLLLFIFPEISCHNSNSSFVTFEKGFLGLLLLGFAIDYASINR